MTRSDRLATWLLKYFVISLALRHLVAFFYFSQYNGLLHDFNVITSVKCVCVCVCVCSLRLRKLVSIGCHGNGCSALCLVGSRGLVKLDGFPATQRPRFRVFLDTRKLRTCLGNFVMFCNPNCNGALYHLYCDSLRTDCAKLQEDRWHTRS